MKLLLTILITYVAYVKSQDSQDEDYNQFDPETTSVNYELIFGTPPPNNGSSPATITEVTTTSTTPEYDFSVFNPPNETSSTQVPPVSISTVKPEDKSGVTGPNLDPNDTSDEDTCDGGVCVPYYLCSVNGTIITTGETLFDIRGGGECKEIGHLCCKLEPGTEILKKRQEPETQLKSAGCGIRHEDGVGFRIKEEDREAQFGEFPWMVAVLYEEAMPNDPTKLLRVYQCGGSLIHPKVVLTATHCVLGKKKAGKKLFIQAGEWNTANENEVLPSQTREVEKVITHKQYNSGALFNDIALLITKTPVEFAENVDVVCLPPAGHTIEKSNCFATGWGKDVFGKGGVYQQILKKLELPYVKRDRCQSLLRKTRLGKHFKLDESFICAGGEEGKDVCVKDGGSPLVCPMLDRPGRYFQAGIVAWGIGCGERDIPGVYAHVAHLRNWIDEQMKENGLSLDEYQTL